MKRNELIKRLHELNYEGTVLARMPEGVSFFVINDVYEDTDGNEELIVLMLAEED